MQIALNTRVQRYLFRQTLADRYHTLQPTSPVFMKFSYPEKLPISRSRKEIIEAIQKNQVVVIAGDTGSGKTTQIPKFCLEAFPKSKKLIGCTQPRRIAASSVAIRVAEEMGNNSDLVGYKIRFQDKTTRKTRIKFMTDGVLLAETSNDKNLTQYGVIIVDEAHERSLNIDFLLGYLKRLLSKRSDLKVIITSATIDTETFSKHFGNAPVITIEGRTYPVELSYSPPHDQIETTEKEVMDHCVETIHSICNSSTRGDTLVFLPTERDIKECCRLLSGRLDSAVVLPLYGRLSLQDQKKIFQKHNGVKVVVATNVAETSVTVPGIRYVVDTGLARISRYNVRAKTTSLPVVKISKASADQRMGRCGRVGPGVCIRLYTEEEYEDRAEFTVPELQRSNLAEVILKMLSLNLGTPQEFPFIDPPSGSAINEGYRLLRELGAIDQNRQLTGRGKKMASMPIDPCISRIILEAVANKCISEIRIISSVLAIQDPRIRPTGQEKEADAAHAEFAHPHSDFMTLHAIWEAYHKEHKKNRSWGALKRFCKGKFLSIQRMREWFDLHDQLCRITSSLAIDEEEETTASYEQIHKSLLSGFTRNISTKKDKRIYQSSGGKELMVFPGSHQFLKSGQWIVAAAFIETGRLYALTVATIEPEWIETVAGHLCKYSHHSPRWQKKSGLVVAIETVSLFGLVLVADRQVSYARKYKRNQPEARKIFITEGLVPSEIKGHYSFLEANRNLIQKWEEKEARLRSRSILVDDTQIFDFYDKNLPHYVYDQRSLNRWLKKTGDADTLKLSEDDILLRRVEESELFDFPSELYINKIPIQVEYHFQPGNKRDGITFKLPIDGAYVMVQERFDWLVPGMLKEKLTFLLKGLPKAVRKRLVPVNESVDCLLDDMEIGKGSFWSGLENALMKLFSMTVHREDWPSEIPEHLIPRFKLFDDNGKTVASGRDLHSLLKGKQISTPSKRTGRLSPEDQAIVETWENTIHTTWDFEGLVHTLTIKTEQGHIAGFSKPMLSPLKDRTGVQLIFSRNPDETRRINRKGNLLLLCLQFSSQFRSLKKYCKTCFSGPSASHLIQLGIPKSELVNDLVEFIALTIFSPVPQEIISKKEFEATCSRVQREGFFTKGQHICQQFMSILRLRKEVETKIRKTFTRTSTGFGYPEEDKVQFQSLLDEIFPVSLLRDVTTPLMEDIDRYLKSLSIRLDRYNSNPSKDQQKALQVKRWRAKLKDPLVVKNESLSQEAAELLRQYISLIQEFQISIFSPELKTKRPVSKAVLDKKWLEFTTTR